MSATQVEVNVKELDAVLADIREQALSGKKTMGHLKWFKDIDGDELDSLMEGHDAVEEVSSAILRAISNDPVAIGATDGTQVISNAKDTFPGGIDDDFVNWGADEASDPTGEIKTKVYELVQDATFAQVFGAFGVPTEKLCLTQSQIVEFCRKHRDKLRTEGCATFFPFQSRGKFFVACVDFDDRGRLEVGVYRFEYGGVWLAGYQRRVVVPQLKTL